MSALTDRIAEVLTGFHVDPSDSVCGCYELTPEDAARVAGRVEAELGLTEFTCDGERWWSTRIEQVS